MNEVKPVVCDYGVYEDGELKLILNSNANARLIKSILDADDRHEVYDITKQSPAN